jgi:hypothetical protein
VTVGPLAATSSAPDISAPWRILGSFVSYHHTTPFHSASLPLIACNTAAGACYFAGASTAPLYLKEITDVLAPPVMGSW